MVGAPTAALTLSSPQYRPAWSKYVTMTNIATRVRNNSRVIIKIAWWNHDDMTSEFNLDSLLQLWLLFSWHVMMTSIATRVRNNTRILIAPSTSHVDITTMTTMSSRNLDSNTAAMATTFSRWKEQGLPKQWQNKHPTMLEQLLLNLFWGFTTFGQNMLLCNSCLLFIPLRWHVYCLYSDVQNMELKCI